MASSLFELCWLYLECLSELEATRTREERMTKINYVELYALNKSAFSDAETRK